MAVSPGRLARQMISARPPQASALDNRGHAPRLASDPSMETLVSATNETITLGGGCFWCVEAVYERVQGVTGVESGYCNGQVANPSYEQVCGGDTGHAEVVRVTFDPVQISLREVLEIFFVVHD